MNKAPLLTRLLCVALVACIMMPVGRELYPYVSDLLDMLQFDAIEAVVSATVGFAIYAVMFGS
jgi:hypothetical protein